MKTWRGMKIIKAAPRSFALRQHGENNAGSLRARHGVAGAQHDQLVRIVRHICARLPLQRALFASRNIMRAPRHLLAHALRCYRLPSVFAKQQAIAAGG